MCTTEQNKLNVLCLARLWVGTGGGKGGLGKEHQRRALDAWPRPLPRPAGGPALELELASAQPELRLGKVRLREAVRGASGSTSGSNKLLSSIALS